MKEEITFEQGSGNVFADLGMANPELELEMARHKVTGKPDSQTPLGFAVQYNHISGERRLSSTHNTVALAKANWLKHNHCDINESWTPSLVNKAFEDYKHFDDAKVVCIFITEVA